MTDLTQNRRAFLGLAGTAFLTACAPRTPSDVFAPYLTEGGAPLRDLARELDAIFAAIATQATAP